MWLRVVVRRDFQLVGIPVMYYREKIRLPGFDSQAICVAQFKRPRRRAPCSVDPQATFVDPSQGADRL